jgi:hypothetical protein
VIWLWFCWQLCGSLMAHGSNGWGGLSRIFYIGFHSGLYPHPSFLVKYMAPPHSS